MSIRLSPKDDNYHMKMCALEGLPCGYETLRFRPSAFLPQASVEDPPIQLLVLQ